MTTTTSRPPRSANWPRPAEPVLHERIVANGLRLVAGFVPAELVEVRLVVPLWRGGVVPSATVRAVLAACLGRRSADRDADAVAAALASIGGSLSVTASTTHLTVSLAALPTGLEAGLDLIADLIAAPGFDATAVAAASRSVALDAAAVTGEAQRAAAVCRSRHGASALADTLPDADSAAATDPDRLTRAMAASTGPAGSSVLVIGAVQGGRALDAVEAAFARWCGPAADPWPTPPAVMPAGDVLVIDRPGAVQSWLALTGPAPRPDQLDLPALLTAVGLLGGGASSRLSVRLRERRGYSYVIDALLEHDTARQSSVLCSTEVATEVTAAALNEIRYEFGRAATTEASREEIERGARRLAGRFVVGLHTPAGLADQLARITAWGAPLGWVADLCRALPSLGPHELRSAAQRYLAPSRMRTVVVADAERVVPSLEALGQVQVLAGDALRSIP